MIMIKLNFRAVMKTESQFSHEKHNTSAASDKGEM